MCESLCAARVDDSSRRSDGRRKGDGFTNVDFADSDGRCQEVANLTGIRLRLAIVVACVAGVMVVFMSLLRPGQDKTGG